MGVRMYRVEYGFIAGRLCTLVHVGSINYYAWSK